ncbi:MAG: 50S ribosomal protein L23 [Phycisphaeraceae bacterium]|nr:MAG: 50S ribosomal protein L23 [Phycisphaeraceae bacterium]
MALDPIYIVKKPVLTEKSTEAMNEMGKYTFEVDRRATKTDIKNAIQSLYEVHVEGVQTKTEKGKLRRMRYGYVREKVRKVATVRLREGEVIELF